MIAAVLLAAGKGKRMGANTNKVYLKEQGKSILAHSLATFSQHEMVAGIFLVIRNGEEKEAQHALSEAGPLAQEKCKGLVYGGTERQDSVRLALEAIPDCYQTVLIHDAARPYISRAVISRVLHDHRDEGVGVIPTIPVKDTIKTLDADEKICDSLPREILAAAQTPQRFPRMSLLHAHQRAHEDARLFTDDAALFAYYGGSVYSVCGEEKNKKMTVPEDLKGGASMRIGMGYDVHTLTKDRPLILGGVTIPHSLGLLGHSDADVALHALSDALLGAAALGDIGTHFPDSDPKFSGADSRVLLRHVEALLKANGFRIVNVDLTICAQKPKIAPYIDQMRSHIAEDLGITKAYVSVKATTTEKLGFVGREEGISAYAVALVEESDYAGQ